MPIRISKKRDQDDCRAGKNDSRTSAILTKVSGGRTQTAAARGKRVAREREIKLKIDNVRAFRRVLKKLGAHPIGARTGRVHEENVIFDTPQGGLAKHGQLLRIRTEAPEVRGRSRDDNARRRVLVTFKRPIARPASFVSRLEERLLCADES